MPFSPTVTVAEAERARAQKLSISRERRVPPTMGVLEEAAARKTFNIFNVGPWPHTINAGSYGNYFVPAVKKGQEFAVCAREVKAIEREYTIKDEFEYNTLLSDGEKFIASLIGDGRGQDPAQSLRHYGVFYSEQDTPTPNELYQAKTMLHAKCAEIVREARDLFAMDRKQFSIVVKRQRHFLAAEVLNLTDEPWMVDQSPSSRKKCAFCGAVNEDFAVKCTNCHEVIDVKRYKELKKAQKEESGE